MQTTISLTACRVALHICAAAYRSHHRRRAAATGTEYLNWISHHKEQPPCTPNSSPSPLISPPYYSPSRS